VSERKFIKDGSKKRFNIAVDDVDENYNYNTQNLKYEEDIDSIS